MKKQNKAGARKIIPVIPAPEQISKPVKQNFRVSTRISASVAILVIIISVLALISTYGAKTTAEPDVTPPNITNMTIASITEISATINYKSDEPADTKVIYGTTSDALDQEYSSAEKVTDHTAAILGLKASTAYYFKAISRDEAGNGKSSDLFNFTTLDDTDAPVPSSLSTSPEQITYAPASQIYLLANWVDASAITTVTFRINTSNQSQSYTSNSGDTYTFLINSLAAGSYEWTTTATDEFNNSNTSPKQYFTVSKAEPGLRLSLDSEENSISVNPNSTINITATAQAEGILSLTLGNQTITGRNSIEIMGFLSLPDTYTATASYSETQNYTGMMLSRQITVQESFLEISADKQDYNIGEASTLTVSAPTGSALTLETCGPIPTNGGFAECRTNSFAVTSNPISINNPYTNKSGNYQITAKMEFRTGNETAKLNYSVLNNLALIIDGPVTVKTGQDFTLTATAAGGIFPYTYNWTLSNGSRLYAQTITLKYPTQGSYPIVIYAKDAESNEKTETTTISVKREFELRVVVQDEFDNSPIEGATVRANGTGADTDDNGLAILMLPEGTHSVKASDSGYKSATETVNLDANKSITMKLKQDEDTSTTGGASTKDIDLIAPIDGAKMTEASTLINAYIDITKKNTTCTLYLDEGKSGWYKEIKKFTFNNPGEIKETLQLGQNQYSWRIECVLGTGRKITSDTKSFKVELSPATEIQATTEVAQNDSVIDAGDIRNKIDEAMNNLDALDYDTKMAADVLGMTGMVDQALRDYERIVRDINNIRFRRDLSDADRERTLLDYRDQMNSLEKKTPMNVKLIESDNFISYPKKDSLEIILSDLKKALIKENNADLDEVFKDQNRLVVSTRIFQMELTMVSGEAQQITLIEKTLTYKGNVTRADYIAEHIPKELEQDYDNIVFLTENKALAKDPIIRFETPESIIYYFKQQKDMEEAKKATTIIVNDNTFASAGRKSAGLSAITGNIALTNIDFTSTEFLIGLIIFIIVLYVAYAFGLFEKLGVMFSYFSRKKVIHEIMMLINDATDYANAGDLQKANMIFKEVKLNYEQCQFHIKREIYEEAIKAFHHLNTKYFENTILQLQDAIKAGVGSDVVRKYKSMLIAYRLLEPEKRVPYEALVMSIEKNILMDFKEIEQDIYAARKA